jgi:hypothetical protein
MLKNGQKRMNTLENQVLIFEHRIKEDLLYKQQYAEEILD